MSCFLSLFMSYFITIPLPLIVSCYSKIQTGFTFLVPAHLGSPGKGAVKRVCVFHQDTACTAYFHCLRVRLLRVTLNINQSIDQFLRPARPIRPSRSCIFLQFHRSRPSHPRIRLPTDRKLGRVTSFHHSGDVIARRRRRVTSRAVDERRVVAGGTALARLSANQNVRQSLVPAAGRQLRTLQRRRALLPTQHAASSHHHQTHVKCKAFSSTTTTTI